MRLRSLRVIAGVTALAALAVAGPAAAHHSHPKAKKHGPPAPPPACVGDPAALQPVRLMVDKQAATGLVAYPSSKPRGLVVFFHGYGHTTESWRGHLTATAQKNGVVAVAMDYRGTSSTGRGWRVAEGAKDSITAAQWLNERCGGFATTVAYSVSMGSGAAGLALAGGQEAVRPVGPGGKPMLAPLFDWWFNIEGAVNVIETYFSARALLPSGNSTAVNAVADIEAEMGGAFEKVPTTYTDRTIVRRAPDIAAAGLKGVVMVHGVGDGLVPYNQSVELRTLLAALGVPIQFWTVVTKTPGTEVGTHPEQYVTGQVPGGLAKDYESPFSGHGSEKSTNHDVINTGHARLYHLFHGEPPCLGEYVIDGTTDTTVFVTC